MKKISLIIGARPNFMKAFPIYEAMKEDFDLTLIHTGQHFDNKMSDVFFNQLKFPKPDIHLTLIKKTKAGDFDNKLYINNIDYLKNKDAVIEELMTYTGDLGQLGEIRDKLKLEFEKIQPDLIIVFGDVTSTLAAGLAAKMLNIELSHVESGLRSGDMLMPEEVNRVLTDHITNYFFVTEQIGVDNLKEIGITKNVYLVGNTMIDTQKKYLQQALDTKYHETLDVKPKQYVLITLHRPSNVDNMDKLKEIFDDLEELSKTEILVYPIHPRTKNNLEKLGYFKKIQENPNIILDEPLGYLEFTSLMAECKYVVTDSGGLQEESTSLNIPCFTLRENTERPSTLIENNGTNQMIHKISEIELKECEGSMDLWDGNAAIYINYQLKMLLLEIKSINIYKHSYNFLKGKRILITGGAGFIGSNIVENLLNKDVKFVRIMDNLNTGKMENIQFLLNKYDNVEFVYGDVSNLEHCRKAVKDMNVITHQAAICSLTNSINDTLFNHNTNVNGFLNLLNAAKEEGIKRIVYASSSSIYGDDNILPKVEENIGNELSSYAATKFIDEIYAGIFTKFYGMECIGLRYFNVFGPRQDPTSSYAAHIPKFINLIKSGQQPIIDDNYTFSYDFTYIDNVVQANILALSTYNEKCFGETFNIGTGNQITLLELINTINMEFQTNNTEFILNSSNYINYNNVNINKAQTMLQYYPVCSFTEGIKDTINFILNKNIITSLNPGQILSKDKNDYIIDYLFNNCENMCIYIDKKNNEICKNFLIPGNKELLKLNYEYNKDKYKEELKFGIVSYEGEFKYGNKKLLPNKPYETTEPIRILIDPILHKEMQNIFKKLIVIKTEYQDIEYDKFSFNELMIMTNESNYKSTFNEFNKIDMLCRNDGLSGKYYDSQRIYQNTDNDCVLYNWFKDYLQIKDKFAIYITDYLNKNFGKNEYLFQNNNPTRISYNKTIGTPIHQDSKSIIIDSRSNNFKNGSFNPSIINDNNVLIEIEQDSKIFNINYSIYEENTNDGLRICERDIENMKDDKSYFYRVKANKYNEAFIFNPSHTLHYRSNQFSGLSIRGDCRIIALEDYNNSDLKNNFGPRQNMNVCFGKIDDCKNIKYSVFSDKIYK